MSSNWKMFLSKFDVIKNNIAFGIPAEKINREMAEQVADNFYLDFVSEEN